VERGGSGGGGRAHRPRGAVQEPRVGAEVDGPDEGQELDTARAADASRGRGGSGRRRARDARPRLGGRGVRDRLVGGPRQSRVRQRRENLHGTLAKLHAVGG